MTFENMSKNKKKLFASSAAYILGLGPILEISGTKDQVASFKEILISSKALYEGLKMGLNNDGLFNLIQEKNERARDLYDKTGIQWPF